jgi:D-3-phosphoglycerate dehydrogenase
MSILIMQPLQRVAMEWLEQQNIALVTHDDAGAWRAHADEVEALIYYSVKIDKPLLDQLPKLRFIGKRGAGIDSVDLDEVRRRGIQVTNVGAGGNATSVAEHAMTLLFGSIRQLPKRDAFARDGHFLDRFTLPLVEEVSGARIGVLGAGQIGRKLIGMLSGGFGCELGVFDPYLPDDVAAGLPVRMFDDVSALCDWAQHVIVAAPLTDESRGAIARDQLRLIGPRGVVVICSRGGIVDEGALADAVDAGEIWGAATDVYDHEPPADDHRFFSRPDIVLTPHVAGASQRSRDNASVMVCQQVCALLRGEDAPVVNAQPWL